MSINLQTDIVATQLVQNVEDLFASIVEHYQVPHIKKDVDQSVYIGFGAYPIKENSVKYSPYNGQTATLRVGKVNDALLMKVFGLTARQLGEQSDNLRKAQGNDVANALPQTFKEKLDAYFGVPAVSMNINTYSGASVSFDVDIRMLSIDVIRAISEILIHSGMVPKVNKVRSFAL